MTTTERRKTNSYGLRKYNRVSTETRWLPMCIGSWRTIGFAVILWMVGSSVEAAWTELLWRNGQPHPGFNNRLHSGSDVQGILDDGTVVYYGSLNTNPSTETGYHPGYFLEPADWMELEDRSTVAYSTAARLL